MRGMKPKKGKTKARNHSIVKSLSSPKSEIPFQKGVESGPKGSCRILHISQSLIELAEMRVGVIGATGAVGLEMVRVLHERREALGGVQEVRLLASERSAGSELDTPFGKLAVKTFSIEAVEGLDVVFLAVSGDFAKMYARDIAQKGILVIDNSSAFRYDPEVPLVVPEINGAATNGEKLIANPNCTTAVAAMALWPLHCRYGIKKLILSTYQAASGAGIQGMRELEDQTRAVADGKKPQDLQSKVFQYPLVFNVIPHIDQFQDNLYSREEMKVVWETRKIFGCPELPVSCTTVRIPTLRAHAEALTIETWEDVDVNEAQMLIGKARGVELVDDLKLKKYPMPLSATGKNDVEAGRIRQSLVFGKKGLDLFVCGDQLLRGAALNAVLIAEYVHNQKFDSEKGYRPSMITRVRNELSLTSLGLGCAIGAITGLLVFKRD